MSIERARAHLAARGLDPARILEFEVSSATVELAARAVGVEEARIAKTLSFRLPEGEGERILLVVAAGDARIDNPKYKARFHGKPRMLEASEAERLIGYAVGGVCPFGVNPGVEVYLDASLRRFETVYPAVGSSNSAICLTPRELEELSGALDWVDVCKLPQG